MFFLEYFLKSTWQTLSIGLKNPLKIHWHAPVNWNVIREKDSKRHLLQKISCAASSKATTKGKLQLLQSRLNACAHIRSNRKPETQKLNCSSPWRLDRTWGWSFFLIILYSFLSYILHFIVNPTYRHSLLAWTAANAIIPLWYSFVFCCNCLHTSLFQKKGYTSQINQDSEYTELWTHTDSIPWKLLKYKTSHCLPDLSILKFWFSIALTVTFRLVKHFVSLMLCGILDFTDVLRWINFSQSETFLGLYPLLRQWYWEWHFFLFEWQKSKGPVNKCKMHF